MYDWFEDFHDQLKLNYPKTAAHTDSSNVFDVMDILLMEQRGSA